MSSVETFEVMLTGGHPNSLGNTIQVVDIVLADKMRFDELYQCYFSDDEVVWLRVSSAMKRLCKVHPDWLVQINTIETLTVWANDDAILKRWLIPRLERLTKSDRKSVAGRAKKMLVSIA